MKNLKLITAFLFVILNLTLSWIQIGHANDSCVEAVRSVINSAKPVEVLKDLSGEEFYKGMEGLVNNRNLFYISDGSNDEALDIVNQTIRYLDNLPFESTHPNRLAGLDQKTATQIYSGVRRHAVAGIFKVHKYDPDGHMGFCFGRAMAVHLEALKRGVQGDKIKKLWAVGSFSTGTAEWRYHVTTIVRAEDGDWWAIDPIMGNAIKYKDWINNMRGYNSNGDMKVFATSASRFSPSGPAKYNLTHLEMIDFNNYFKDLLKSYRETGPVSGPRLYPKP